jgi:uncharacterized OsmC-like protein
MTSDELRALQAPLKDRYRSDPASALRMHKVSGEVKLDKVTCNIKSDRGAIEAGLHPSAGGTGEFACAGDMLLEALVGCAGVTLGAVATALKIPIRSASLRAEGDLDYRGTLGVSKEVDIGFKAIRLYVDLDTDATSEQVESLLKLIERYCVVYQTLKKSPTLTTIHKASRTP